MKYDRPVWQIMHQCADAMPEVFRYEDVRNWFSDHYPDVNEATIRAHLIGLTEGGRAKHVQFAQRSPIFQRVARGEYAPIPKADRGEDPDGPAPSASKIKMSGNGAHKEPERVGHDDVADDVDGSDGSDGSDESFAVYLSPDREVSHDADDAVVRDPLVPDVILLGSVGERVNVPAPAKEVFREVSFQRSRLEAELSGSEWFILSAEHGLVAPNEWVSPDSRTLADMDPDYRVVWASWVVARLQSLVGSLDDLYVRVDAPNAFIGPLFADLQEAGAVVSSGDVPSASSGRTDPTVEAGTVESEVIEPEVAEPEVAEPETVEADLAEAEMAEAKMAEPDVVDPSVAPEPADAPLPPPAPAAATTAAPGLAQVVAIDAISTIAGYLADARRAVPASDVSSLPESPGLYGWFVDPAGARELNRSLRLPVRAGLVFVGQVGGSSWQSLADPVLNLRDHVERIQLHGRTRASTFRMTLATVLRERLRMTTVEDPQLTDWMLTHLSVTTWPTEDFGELRELEQLVIRHLDPPLNVDHLPATEYRARLTQMRSALG